MQKKSWRYFSNSVTLQHYKHWKNNKPMVTTWIFRGSGSILVTADGCCLLVHLVGLLALLPICTSWLQLALSGGMVINTAVRGKQAPHLHRNLSGWGVWSGVDRRRWDGWQWVSEDSVFVRDVRCTTVLVPNLNDTKKVKDRLVYMGFKLISHCTSVMS